MRSKIKNFLLQLAKPLSDDIFGWESKNIARWRQQQALKSTGEWIEETIPTLQSFDSRYSLLDHCLKEYEINNQEGLVCEFGVAGGKSINYIAERIPSKVIYGFDSFEGLPEDWRDGAPKGTFKMKNLPKVRSNVELLAGTFDKTIPGFLDSHPSSAALLHIDCDLYSSTKFVFDLFANRVQKGSILVFDEFFNYPGWQLGEFKAFAEFIERSGLGVEYVGYNRYGTQLAVRIGD